MIKELVHKSRSYRRFDGSHKISMQTLEHLVDLARHCPSAANKQPLRYVLCTCPEKNARIYEATAWAAYLKDWDGPEPAERPTAYIIIVNTAPDWKFAQIDLGIMAQTMLLGATDQGLGGCMIGALNREKLCEVITLAEGEEISLVLALGKPVEDVRIVNLPADGSIKYYRDDQGVHYVPKRSLDDLIIGRME